MIGNRAYPANDEKSLVLALTNNILGGPGMNSRLNMAVRERHGLSYHIESAYQPYSDTGVFEVYLGSETKASGVPWNWHRKKWISYGPSGLVPYSSAGQNNNSKANRDSGRVQSKPMLSLGKSLC
jgi:hypothetical protein